MELFTTRGALALLWLTAFASAVSAQVTDYTHALRVSRSAGDATAIELLERLTEREPEFLQAYRTLIAITRRSGAPQRAEQHFQSLLDSPHAKPYAHYALAAYYNAQREHARAEVHALECLQILPDLLPAYGEMARAASDPERRTRITKWIEDRIQTRPRSAGPLFAKGMLQVMQNQWAEAIPPLVKADELEPDTWEIPEALFFSYYRTDQSTNTLKILNRALAITRKADNVEREAIVLGRIGIVQSDLGDYENAREHLTKAIGIVQELGLEQLEQAYQGNLGNTLLLTGRHAEALRHLEQALAIARKTGDRQNEGRNMGLIASVHLDAADYPAAIRAFAQAAEIARETGDKNSEADQTASLALIHSVLGDEEKALQFVSRAIEMARAARNPWLEGRFLEISGNIQSRGAAHQKALIAFREGIEIAKRIGDKLGEASRSAYAAETEATLGRRAAALEGLERALRLTRDIGARSIEGRILNDLGKVHAALGHPGRALESYRAAREAGEDMRMAEVLWRAHAGIAGSLEKLKEYAEAASHYKMAIDAIEKIRSLLPLPEEKTGFFGSKTEVYSDYVRLLAAMHEKEPSAGLDAEALYVVERSRARSLLEMTAEARARSGPAGAGDELAQVEAQLGSLQRELAREYARGATSTVKISNVRSSLIDAEDRYQALRRESRQSQVSALRSPEPVRLAEAQKLLDSRSAMLVYSAGPDVSHLFVITANRLEIARLPGLAELERRVTALREAVSKRPAFGSAHPYIREARSLYRLLIEPAERALAGKTGLIIAPDGPLHFLPFPLLLTGDVTAETAGDYRKLPYLVRKYRIGCIPSISVLAAIRARDGASHSRRDPALVLADPVYAGQRAVMQTVSQSREAAATSFARLLYSRQEAENIRRLYAASRPTVLTGREATEENLRNDSRLAEYGIIHFAVHGVVNEIRPQFSALVLSAPGDGAREDGMLYAYEVSRLSINASLVSLSACSTALGKSAHGEGLIGLTHAFLSAGAASVLATLWRVDDRSVATLMTGFYRALRTAAESKAGALRRAQLQLIESLPFAHPYYWAGFSVFGDYR